MHKLIPHSLGMLQCLPGSLLHEKALQEAWHSHHLHGLLPRGSPAATLEACCTTGLQNHCGSSALPLETSSAPDVALSPRLNFRATWGALPGCCQPALAHSSAVTLTTPRRLSELGGCCPAAVGASRGCPGKAARAGGGAQPAEKVWQGTGSQLGLPFKLSLWDETVFPLEFAMSYECWLDLSREFILTLLLGLIHSNLCCPDKHP